MKFPDADDEERKFWDAMAVAVARASNSTSITTPSRWADAALQYRRDSFGVAPSTKEKPKS